MAAGATCQDTLPGPSVTDPLRWRQTAGTRLSHHIQRHHTRPFGRPSLATRQPTMRPGRGQFHLHSDGSSGFPPPGLPPGPRGLREASPAGCASRGGPGCTLRPPSCLPLGRWEVSRRWLMGSINQLTAGRAISFPGGLLLVLCRRAGERHPVTDSSCRLRGTNVTKKASGDDLGPSHPPDQTGFSLLLMSCPTACTGKGRHRQEGEAAVTRGI